jgi:hypothetical protein
MRVLVLKLLALVAWVGGPLYVCDALVPELGSKAAFGVTFAPIGVLLVASFAAGDAPSRWVRFQLLGGLGAAAVLTGANLFTAARLLAGDAHPNPRLLSFGIAGGSVAVGLFLLEALPVLRGGRGALGPGWQRRARPPADPLAPGAKDFFLVGISVAFVLIAVWMWRDGREPEKALGIGAFFLLCASVLGGSLLQKLRFRRQRAVARVEVAGGTRFAQRRGRMALLGAGVAGTGLALLAPTWRDNVVLGLCALLMALGGLVVLAGLLTGRLGSEFLALEPEGLRFGHRRWSVLVRWEQVRDVGSGSMADNPLLLLRVVDPEAVLATAEGPEGPARARARVAKRMRQTQQWTGCDFSVMTGQYGVDLPLLVRAIEGYLAEPSRRPGLAPRPPLAASTADGPR